MKRSIIVLISIILVSCSSEEKELQSIRNELRSINRELNDIKQKLDENNNEDISKSKVDVIFEEKETIIYSKIIEKLPNDSVYVLYNSDFEGQKPDNGRMEFEYETVYFLPIEDYSYENYPKGKRISEIGFNRGPVWNKKGDKIAYLNFVQGINSNKFENGNLVIRDVSTGDLKTYDNLKAKPYGLAWDESGNIIAYGQENSICTLNIEENKTQSLYYTDNKPEGISISPDGNYIMFMTRDGKESNDKNGWSPNLLNINTKESIKISEKDDGITTFYPYRWHKSSSKVIFRGNQKNEKHLGEYWEYDLKTKELKAYIGNLDGFYDQSIRYWDASKLERNRKYIKN